MSTSRQPTDFPVPLEAVVTTDELRRRPSRPPDYEAENQALRGLAHELSTAPSTILQKLVETAFKMCRADSAGVSLLEEEAGRKILRWHAVAGQWAPLLWNTTPRDNSPCGTVLDQNATLLFSNAHRYYAQFAGVQPLLVEGLLVPFHVGGQAVGTVWVVAHDERRQFDAEDQRVLESIAAFASAAYQVFTSARASRIQADSLRESEHRFRSMIDALPVAIYTTDAEGRLTHYNPAAAEFSGRTPILGSDHWCVSFKLHRPDGTPLPHDECPMAIALKEGRAVRGTEAIAERPDGTRIWFEPFPTPLRDGAGNIVGGINMLVDTTDRRRRENTNALLGAIVDSSDDAIISKDLDGIITSWNKSAERVFGYAASEVVGRSVAILLPSDRRHEEPMILERLKRGDRVEHFETVRVRKDGGALDISLTISPLRDSTGRVIGASKIARDITERKRIELELRDADRRKSEFLAMLAHELRNPLAPIRNSLQILRLPHGDERARRPALDVMERQVDQMVRLIDDLMDVSRISRGRIELRRELVELELVVAQAVEAARPLIASMDHELSVTLPPTRTHLHADPTRLAQVVGNLLNNACKFTEKGGRIQLTIAHEGQRAAIRVQDSGLGIAADQLPRIFEMFTQVDTSLERSRGGLGIGLALAKNLVEMHGGTLDVRSAGLGRGSEFVVRLPVISEPHLPQERSENDQVTMVRRRILVVDDNRDSARTLAMLLNLSGHEVQTVHDGVVAVEAAAEYQPDAILLDIGLPGVDGYEAARRIRAQRRPDRSLFMVALTGWGQEEDRRRSEEAGFDAHLVKPVDFDVLEKLLAEMQPLTV